MQVSTGLTLGLPATFLLSLYYCFAATKDVCMHLCIQGWYFMLFISITFDCSSQRKCFVIILNNFFGIHFSVFHKSILSQWLGSIHCCSNFILLLYIVDCMLHIVYIVYIAYDTFSFEQVPCQFSLLNDVWPNSSVFTTANDHKESTYTYAYTYEHIKLPYTYS